jgi:Mg-chelatase subunit ChlI
LLQSPLVADLLAVAATAALAALAEHGFSSRSGGDDAVRGKRAGKAVKEAGKAAAAAIGRRLSTELEEIREAAKSKAGAEA